MTTTKKTQLEDGAQELVTAAPPGPPGEGAAGEPDQVNLQVHLRKIPLLAELSEEDMLRVKGELRIRQYTKREIVLQKGASGDSLLFLLSGSLQVIDITEDGRAIGLRMLTPGDFFGEIAVINGSMRSASVVALTPVLVALLPRADRAAPVLALAVGGQPHAALSGRQSGSATRNSAPCSAFTTLRAASTPSST
jgi:CRP/FNR family cyclic AMP-dependent transcriptional regulator